MDILDIFYTLFFVFPPFGIVLTLFIALIIIDLLKQINLLEKNLSTFAILSFISGAIMPIIFFLGTKQFSPESGFFYFFSFITLFLTTVILGFISLRQINKKQLRGKNLVYAGIILIILFSTFVFS